MKSLRRFAAALPLLALSLVTILAGCGSNGFKTFSIKEGPQGFNFEYPDNYKVIRLDMSDMSSSNYTTVGLGTTINNIVSEIYVYIWPASDTLQDSSTVLDTLLTNAKGVLTDYTLDTKVGVAVNGHMGQGASFTATDTDSTTATSSGPAYYRVTCFVYNSWIVELDMTCGAGLKATTQDQYTHLLDTFALLN